MDSARPPAALPGAGPVGVAEVPGHAAGLRPQAPGKRDAGQAGGAAPLGEAVQEGVGGGVVALAGRAEHARGRGEEDQLREVVPAGEFVQVPGGVGLGPQHRADPLAGERVDGAVVEQAGRVHHGGERMCGVDQGQQGGHVVAFRHVGDGHGDPGTGRGQLVGQRAGAGGVQAAAAREQQVPDAVLGDQVAGQEAAQLAGAAGDQHGAGGVPGARDGEHDLSGVPGLCHEPERVGGVLDVPGGERQVVQYAGLEERDQLGEHLADACRASLDEVERAVGDAPAGADLRRVADVGLAHLDEPAAVAQQPQRRVHELA
nr:hypothetical protein GCM10020092_032170 [Actinoplanes digitatis]